MGDLVNGRGVILADLFAFKANLLARSFNNFVQPIYITGYRKKIDISLTGTVVPVTEIQTYSPLLFEISKSTKQISMCFLILKVPKYFFLLGVFYFLKID